MKGGAHNGICQEKMEPFPEEQERTIQEDGEEDRDTLVNTLFTAKGEPAPERPCVPTQGLFICR